MRFSRLCYYLKVALIPISVAFAFGFSGLTVSATDIAIVSVLAPARPVRPGSNRHARALRIFFCQGHRFVEALCSNYA
jgi:hypothetical protein